MSSIKKEAEVNVISDIAGYDTIKYLWPVDDQGWMRERKRLWPDVKKILFSGAPKKEVETGGA